MADVQGIPARAAVLDIGERHTDSDGDSSFSTFRAKANVRLGAAVVLLPPGTRAAALGRGALLPGTPDWVAAGLGSPQKIRLKIPTWAFQILLYAGNERLDDGIPDVPGPIDIPVWADPQTGAILEVDTDTLVKELEPQFELGKKIWKQEDAPLSSVRGLAKAPRALGKFFGSLPKEWSSAIGDMVNDMKGNVPPRPVGIPRPGEPNHPPVEGVDYRTWVIVKAGLVRDSVHPAHVDAYAEHRGVPKGRWTAVDAAWSQRAEQDPNVQVWSAYDVHRMTPTGTAWTDDPDT